jgi:predicted amidohydrolase YtcJ
MTIPAHADKSTTAPDLIIVNAVIHTMDKTNPLPKRWLSMATASWQLVLTEEIRKLAAEYACIDAKKRLVLHGFNDAHTHFMSGGFQLVQVSICVHQTRRKNSLNEFEPSQRSYRKDAGLKAETGTTNAGPMQSYPPKSHR